MIRNLLVITGVGFVLALVGIGGSVALVGNDVRRNDWTWVVTDDEAGDSGFHLERGKVSPETVRTIEWTGGERLSVDVPGQVTYIQGNQPGVRITGPKDTVDKVRFSDGRLIMVDDDRSERGYIRWTGTGIRVWSETEALRVEITAPAVHTFEMGEHGRLKIRGYDQPNLDLTINGNGEVEADGRAPQVTVTVNGDGDTDLRRLEVVDAKVDLTGRGDVTVGPTGRADIDISGHGDVTLTRNPAQLNQSITGWGEVDLD